MITKSEDSLFTYGKGEDWSIYYKPDFVPVYKTDFKGDQQLEMEANNTCEEDKCCKFDIAATGNVAIGNESLNQENR